MATKLKFPIRYKILAVLSVVVVAAVAVYLYLAAKLFYEDKTVLIYELNENTVRTLSADVAADLRRVVDKLRLVATLSVRETGKKTRSEPREFFADAFSADDELVKVAVLTAEGPGKPPARTFFKIWPEYLENYKKDSAYLDRVRDLVPVPFEKVLAQGLWVRNATLEGENNPPLMTVAIAIETTDPTSPRRVVYADVRLDRMLEAIGMGGIAVATVVDSEMRVLASTDHAAVQRSLDLSNDPLARLATTSKVRSEVKRFDVGGKSYLGSYHQTGLAGVNVVSRVETGQAFAAAERLIRKSLVFALLVVTTAFLVALFFSHHLTKPIRTLLEATQRIARGDFNQLVKVTSHDELATLAASFNLMTTDLKLSREQIEEYSRDLEKKVKDRTARLEASNIAIKEAQEALVRTTRLASVGEVAGRAAHEVLNPLTNVTARLEKMQLLGLKPDTDDARLLGEIVAAWNKDFNEGGRENLLKSLSQPSTAQQGKTLLEEDLENLMLIAADLSKRMTERASDIEFVLKEAGRINRIVNGMRQLTRVSGDRRVLDLSKVVDELMATMADILEKNRIAISAQYAEVSHEILADRDELIQVLSNLVRNSMQAIQEARRQSKPVGEPARIWFVTERVAKESGARILLRVCDNGPGIPEENFSQVFEASFTTKSVEDGTGLGLSIARRFIRALDGEIIVEKSVPGVETVFLIDLPEHVEAKV